MLIIGLQKLSLLSPWPQLVDEGSLAQDTLSRLKEGQEAAIYKKRSEPQYLFPAISCNPLGILRVPTVVYIIQVFVYL